MGRTRGRESTGVSAGAVPAGRLGGVAGHWMREPGAAGLDGVVADRSAMGRRAAA